MFWQLTVKYQDQSYQLTVSGEQDLLSQMREQLPLPLRRACKNGVCTICRCRVVAGQTTYGQRQAHGLWEQETRDGYILPCIAMAQSDVVIDELSLDMIKKR